MTSPYMRVAILKLPAPLKLKDPSIWLSQSARGAEKECSATLPCHKGKPASTASMRRL